MKKISVIVKKIAEAIAAKLEAEEVRKLEAGEVDEDFLATIGDKVLNNLSTFQDNTKKTGRQELYTKLDEKVFADTKLAAVLGEEKANKIKALKGSEKVIQLHTSYLEAIEALKTAKQGADTPADVKAYAEQLAKVTNEFEAFKQESAGKLTAREQELLNQYNQDLLGERLFNKVQSIGILGEAYKGEKFIQRMVIPAVTDRGNEKGLMIDAKTLKVTKKDGTPFFTNGGAEYTIDDLIEESIEEDYKKKGDPAPTGIVATDSNPKPKYVPSDPIANQVKPMVAV